MRKNPFDKSYIFMAKNITIDEIFEYTFKNEKNISLVKRVIKKYFSIVYKYLLEGKIVELPNNFAKLYIAKKKASELTSRKEKTKKRYDKCVSTAIKEKQFNYKKIGFFYMVATGGFAYEEGMYLKPPKDIKKILRENIINGKDYRYEKYGINKECSQQSA
tara:strand:+ start:858 stop:1340 length:483 start_codon:yes stop_codon:yes gene_type:complete